MRLCCAAALASSVRGRKGVDGMYYGVYCLMLSAVMLGAVRLNGGEAYFFDAVPVNGGGTADGVGTACADNQTFPGVGAAYSLGIGDGAGAAGGFVGTHASLRGFGSADGGSRGVGSSCASSALFRVSVRQPLGTGSSLSAGDQPLSDIIPDVLMAIT